MNGHKLPSRAGYRLRLWQSLAGSAALLLLVGALLVPTPLDAVRAEQAILRHALDAQAQRLADLRADLATHPEISAATRDQMNSQLKSLEAQLRADYKDRSAALALIAGTEDKVRDLMPGVSSADFDDLIRAAQILQAGASTAIGWDPASTTGTTELSKAADALVYTKGILAGMTTVQSRAGASSMERAVPLAATKDEELAQALSTAATALRDRNIDKARAPLDTAVKRLLEDEKQQQSAQAVEQTLSKLEDARQTIAQAGAPTSTKSQVGFRRTNPSQNSSTDTTAQDPTGRRPGKTLQGIRPPALQVRLLGQGLQVHLVHRLARTVRTAALAAAEAARPGRARRRQAGLPVGTQPLPSRMATVATVVGRWVQFRVRFGFLAHHLGVAARARRAME